MSEGFYTPEEDVTEVGADGVPRLVAAKGVPIPMDEARRRGLVKDNQKAGPQETKEESAAPSVTFTPAPEFEAAIEEGEPEPKKKSSK